MATIAKSELEQILDGLQKQGGRIEHGGDNHIRIYPPDGGKPISMAATPSDPRALANYRAAVRRAGMIWPLDPTPVKRKTKPVTIQRLTDDIPLQEDGYPAYVVTAKPRQKTLDRVEEVIRARG